MGKLREKLLRLFGKGAPAVSESTSTSISSPTEQHIPPDVPAKLVIHPEAEEYQRLSCWDQAAESLRIAQPEVYTKLENIKSGHKNWSQSDPAGLLKLVESKTRENKGIPRVVETTIRSILQFKDTVAAAANFDPHRIAPVVWRGFCIVLEACLNQPILLREALRDLDTITANLSYWAQVESLFLGTTRNEILNNFKRLEPELIKLYIEILKLEVELVNLTPDKVIAQVVKTQERAVTWRDLVKNISNYHGTCKSTFDLCRIEAEQLGKVKKWISEYDPKVAHDDTLRRTGVALKYRACGEWLLDSSDFRDWSSPKPALDRRIFWLRGTAGTGKSTLLARIIEWHLDRLFSYPGRRFAYFYCSRGTDLNSKHSYMLVLQALLQQVAYDPMTGQISPHVLNAYINSGGDSEDLRPFPFSKYETLLQGILESGIKLRIIIDALDECDKPKELLKALRDASRVWPDGLELLVSSRYEVRVHEKFSNAVKVDLGQSVSNTDMITYITTEVKDRENDERILEGEYPDLEDRLIEILYKRAGGMFRWVQLQLSLFFEPNNFSILYPETVEKYLEELGTGSVAGEEDLNKAYDEIFERNTHKSQLEHRHASKIYKILLCNRQPLSMAAITTAVAFDENNGSLKTSIKREHICRLTQDFIVETRSGTLEFAHVSVKDYLQRKHQSVYSDAECHAQVARTCLKYISYQDKDAYKVVIRSNEFLQYSHEFWGEHCAQLSKEARQRLGVSKELLDWIIEGSGLTTFQYWLYATTQFPRHSIRSLTSDSNSPVFSACAWNLVEVLEKLLSVNPAKSLNIAVNDEGHTPLSLAACRGHKAVVELLLEEGAGVNTVGEYGWTPLHRASSGGHVEVAKLLLEKGAGVNTADKDGRTPLHNASWRGHVEVVKLLLEKGASVNTANKYGQMPLHDALSREHVKVVKLLLEKGAGVNTADRSCQAAARKWGRVNTVDENGQTLLHDALLWWRVEVVKLLLEKGAGVNTADEDGRTPLHNASWRGHVEVVKLLLEKGAGVNTADKDGRTPLHNASWRGHVEVVKLLLEKGAGVNTAGENKQAPLHDASWRGHVEVVKLLLEKGASVNTHNENRQTPLHDASWRGHVEVVKLLLEKRAGVDTVGENRRTPLHDASWKGHVEVAKLLLEKGACVNTADKYGQTPLHDASSKGQVEIVKLLLEKKASVNTANKYKQTPLHCALSTGHVEVVKMLFEKGAGVNTADEDRQIPLHNALSTGHVEVVKLLVEEGVGANTANDEGQTPLGRSGQATVRKRLKVRTHATAFTFYNTREER